MTETAVSAHRDEQQQVMLAMILMILAMLLLPAIDAIAKGLAGSVPPGQIAWSRFFFQLLLLAPFVLWRGGLEIGNYLWAHVARGVLIALATLCFFTAVRVMPLADAIAVFFVQPFIVTLLAAGLLGETFGWRRLVAIVCGFLGAMLIVKPSYEVFGLTALLPVGAALCFSLYFILTRWLTQTQTALGMQFLSGVFGCLAMSIALLVGGTNDVADFTPVWPSVGDWLMLALLGAIATGGHILIVLALNRASIAVLAPFQYLEIISATLLGLVFFGDFPDAMTWAGIAIIVGSGLYVFYRERRLAQRGPAT